MWWAISIIVVIAVLLYSRRAWRIMLETSEVNSKMQIIAESMSLPEAVSVHHRALLGLATFDPDMPRPYGKEADLEVCVACWFRVKSEIGSTVSDKANYRMRLAKATATMTGENGQGMANFRKLDSFLLDEDGLPESKDDEVYDLLSKLRAALA
jgi:hypothetical protein